MANPFLDDADVPGAYLPATPPVRATSPEFPVREQSEDIHRNTIHSLPTDPLRHVDRAAFDPQDIQHGLEDMRALTNRILELETNMINLRRDRDRVTENARNFNAESLRSRGFREGTFASNSTYTNEHPRNKIKPSDLPKFYGKDNEDIDEWIEKVSAIFTPTLVREIPNSFEFSPCCSKVTPPNGSLLWAMKAEQDFKPGLLGKPLCGTGSTFPTMR
jgi:hypothetical protein